MKIKGMTESVNGENEKLYLDDFKIIKKRTYLKNIFQQKEILQMAIESDLY